MTRWRAQAVRVPDDAPVKWRAIAWVLAVLVVVLVALVNWWKHEMREGFDRLFDRL